MDHGQLSMVVDKFQWVFSESLLNACGKDVKFCRRQRVITPFRLGLALTATCASQRVETIADFPFGQKTQTHHYHGAYGPSSRDDLFSYTRKSSNRVPTCRPGTS